MQEADFRDGIRTIQVALQVEPDPKRQTSKDIESNFRQEFVDYLWKLLHRTDPDCWQRAVDRLCTFKGKPVDFTSAHFIEALQAVREEDALEGRRWRPRPPSRPIDLKKLSEDLLKDPTVPGSSKRYISAMAERQHENAICDRPEGGEKYRKQTGKN